ncbi:M4 family metallopeptidase [Polyangium aurulentum]|uniref:M4 family metallopeptidase n=1 Tax=Polyangium aurulentum TaxID=2567896 RepID=UPI0010AEDE1F|nr:M4 family metallopeptidase [Polyangium aurulentum]UQA54838.1 M4 family metallopeptidase [Polyangium aurulentum]
MSERRFGRLSGFKAGMAVFIAAPVVSLSLYGCSSAGPVEFGTGSVEELELAKELSLQELELHIMPEMANPRDNVDVRRVFVDDLAMAHTHVQQKHRGVPVFGGEAIVHLNKDGSYAGVTDAMSRRIPDTLDVKPTFNAEKARDLVLGDYECVSCLTGEPKVDLFVYPHGREMRLAYRVQLHREDGTEKTAMPVYFIDAHTGEKLLEYNNLQTATGVSLYSGTVTVTTSVSGSTYYLEDTTKKIGTFNNNNTPSSNTGNGTTSRYTDTDNTWDSAAQKAGVDAHWGATQVYDYYKSVHGRNGINGVGGPGATASAVGGVALITSKVHYGSSYNNAYWNGSWMTYGDGDGSTFSPLVSLDICGHEMTHGVITATANLTYQGESGALNEGIADIFGAMVEAYAKGGVTAKTWKIGEEVFTPSNGTNDALRYMDNPHLAGNSGFTADDDPDHYTERYTGTGDNGGVHINSGIVNKMFHLLVAGGSHHKGGSMTGIGADPAAKIVYRALTTYMTQSTNFAGARLAMEKAATDLHGAGSAQLTAVSTAWYLCGVGAAPGGGGGSPTNCFDGALKCAHKETVTGIKLTSTCSGCATTVCGADPYCCTTQWDSQCVSEANSMCKACQ